MFFRSMTTVWDHALMNILTLIFVFIQAMTLLGWFCFSSGYGRRIRVLVPVLLLAIILPLVASLRIDATTGNLIPTEMRWRWSKKQDERLEKLGPIAANVVADLSHVTDDDFPGFLGPHRNAVIDDRELDADWTRNPPKELWRRPIGAGWSSFAAVNGFAVTLEQRGEEEFVTCYDLENGQPVWHHAVVTRHETVLGGVGPRSTPTIHEGKVYALGATGVLRCLDGATGKLLWKRELFNEVSIDQPQDESLIAWGRSGSPLIVGDTVIVPGGGPADRPVTLFAWNKDSGEKVWSAGSVQIGYASPTLGTIGGREQLISVNEASVSGHDPQTGEILWTYDFPGRSNANANTSQPTVFSGDRVLLSKAYGAGAQLIQLTPASDSKWTANPIWQKAGTLKTKFTNVAAKDELVFGLSDGVLECVDWLTGKTHWKSGRYGHGQLLRVGSHLLVLSEDGQLSLVAADPTARRELARIQALEGKTWNNLCLYGDKLIVRNSQEAACYQLTLTKAPAEEPSGATE